MNHFNYIQIHYKILPNKAMHRRPVLLKPYAVLSRFAPSAAARGFNSTGPGDL